MVDLEKRVAELERTVGQLQDRLAIMQLIASYGPAVDSVSAGETAALWTEDGTYDLGGEQLLGAEAVGALVDLPGHRGYVASGCSHVMAMPVIAIDGDTATVVGYSHVYTGAGDGWKVERASANCWNLVRTPGGWRVRSRINRLLDGSEDARAILRKAFAPG